MSEHASSESSNDQSGDPFAQMEKDMGLSYNQGLTPLHPPQKSLIQVNAFIAALILVTIAAVANFILQDNFGIPLGSLVSPVGIVALFAIFFIPNRIYRRWGYDIGAEQLRVLRGYLWRTDTIVPFNRIQHIDVAQGPLQRMFGLSTLIVHTAGTHNSIVTLPGLHTPTAEAMRETIKGHIRQEMI